jgi:hypothetical protein
MTEEMRSRLSSVILRDQELCPENRVTTSSNDNRFFSYKFQSVEKWCARGWVGLPFLSATIANAAIPDADLQKPRMEVDHISGICACKLWPSPCFDKRGGRDMDRSGMGDRCRHQGVRA